MSIFPPTPSLHIRQDKSDPTIWHLPRGYQDMGDVYRGGGRAAIIDIELPEDRILNTVYDGCMRFEGVRGLFKTSMCKTTMGLRREWQNAGLYRGLLDYAMDQREMMLRAVHGSDAVSKRWASRRFGFSTMHALPHWHRDTETPENPNVNVCVINLIGQSGTRIANSNAENTLDIPVHILNQGEETVQTYLESHFADTAVTAKAGQAVVINLSRGQMPAPVQRCYHAAQHAADNHTPRAAIMFEIPRLLR